MRHLPLLLELTRMGAYPGPCRVTSKEIAKRVDSSQQSAARWLAELSKDGLIERTTDAQGQTVKLTSEGSRILRSIYHDLEKVFGVPPRKAEISGKVVSGLGEGSYYMSQEGYQKQFKEKLGFEPYPATIDVELNGESLEAKEMLQSMKGIHIEGFTTPERTFGSVKCFRAEVVGKEAALLLPSRTHYEEVVEVVSPKELDLEEGDRIKVEVEL